MGPVLIRYGQDYLTNGVTIARMLTIVQIDSIIFLPGTCNILRRFEM